MQQHLIVWLIGFVVPVLLVVGADARGYHRAIATARLASDDGHRHMMWGAVSPGGLGRAVFRLGRGLVTIGFVVWLAAIMVQHFLADTTMANFDSTMTHVAQEHSTRVMLYAMWHAAMLGSPRFTAEVVVVTGLAMRIRMKTWRPFTILAIVYAGAFILEVD